MEDSELDKYRKELYERAKKVTPYNIAGFIQELMEQSHDYNTCVYATAAAAIAGMSIMADKLGITGFQAGAVMWEYMREAHHIEYPSRLLTYGDMLYPQYGHKYKTISKDIWEWLQKEARRKLDEDGAKEEPFMVQSVRDHMQTIVDGIVPFGYKVKEG
ncbi:hypothetical protein LCGC14_1808240 [marine sediment metagenome]|uniref:Uncharacterized protein n=1 Tax=marine sediment metagenome TaxID=412755 RepID=A0A0F9HAL0_9ZZZZ